MCNTAYEIRLKLMFVFICQDLKGHAFCVSFLVQLLLCVEKISPEYFRSGIFRIVTFLCMFGKWVRFRVFGG